jgi:hypothetical protein
MPKRVSISAAELARHFHLNLEDAAQELGACTTVLKKLCRRYGTKIIYEPMHLLIILAFDRAEEVAGPASSIFGPPHIISVTPQYKAPGR